MRMKLNLIVGETVLTATMYDNKSTKDFIALLPLTLTLWDFNRTKKSAHLPQRLSADEVPKGVRISAGDINYYTPFRNLSLFYQDSGLSFCQVTMGKIDNDGIDKIRDIAGAGSVEVRFEVA